MFSASTYSHTSSSVQLDSGKTRIDSPSRMRVLKRRQSSGRWLRGSQACAAERNEKMRSFARLFSSSRRAPPNAASKRPSSSACLSDSVFITCVWSCEPEAMGEMPRFTPSWLMWTIRSRPSLRAVSSRNAIISRNFQVVSTCSSGNGGFAGWKAFIATCSMTLESLPIEYSITGLRISATTSRMMWMDSASSRLRWAGNTLGIGLPMRGALHRRPAARTQRFKLYG